MARPPSFQRPAKERYLILAAVLGGIVLIGIVIGSRLSLTQPNIGSELLDRTTILTEITLGTLVDPSQAQELNPALRQRPSYKTEEPLALRITTAPDITQEFEVGGRLLTESGQIIELDPPSFRLPPGTSTFCCWQVSEPGTYTLQIFRPEKVISSVPLVIVQGSQAPAGTGTLQLF